MQTADEAFEPGQRKKSSAGGKWRGIILLQLTWIILFGMGIWYGYASWKFASAGEKVPATVVALAESYSPNSVTTYSPVFEYSINGRSYTYESINASDPPSHQVGDQVTLLVDPTDPEKARENSFWELWLLPVIMCPVSLLTAVIANGAMFVTKPWKR